MTKKDMEEDRDARYVEEVKGAKSADDSVVGLDLFTVTKPEGWTLHKSSDLFTFSSPDSEKSISLEARIIENGKLDAIIQEQAGVPHPLRQRSGAEADVYPDIGPLVNLTR